MCSGHFHGGEKKEGDVPVADPQVDPPLIVELPPPAPKRTERRNSGNNNKRQKIDHKGDHKAGDTKSRKIYEAETAIVD